ncbi:hypothetical protein ONE63_000501 [Megalurothrips usitatus]|uniref:NTR domain-containing protein n=1 Tax=Megalurothrips usitatus TaxID=439358 RepID=A0AAV7XYM2_9NEOP|nr:hypothetical protein ONE63_000501 [Megalurothrips usitatus]
MSEGPLWLLVLAALAALALGPRPAAACMCLPAHPQEQFCRADFAVLAEVVSSQDEDGGMLRRYQVAVKRTFKGGSAARILLKEAGVVTPASDGMCGVTLEAGSAYLLMGRAHGRQPYLSLCDAPTPWRRVTVRQRKGLRQQYGHSCGCKPAQCPWWHGSTVVDDCLVAHSVCSPHPPHPKHPHRRRPRCNWLRGKVLDACLRKAGVANVDGEHSWWLLRPDEESTAESEAAAGDKQAPHSNATAGLELLPDP